MSAPALIITPEIKAELKKTDIEHTLLIDEEGNLKLVAWEHISDAVGGDDTVTAFVFELDGKSCVACWNNKGSGTLKLPNIDGDVKYVSWIDKKEIQVERDGEFLKIPVEEKRYLITDMPMTKLKEAFALAVLEFYF